MKPLRVRMLGENEEPPWRLLEDADPSRRFIQSYLDRGDCYVGEVDSDE